MGSLLIGLAISIGIGIVVIILMIIPFAKKKTDHVINQHGTADPAAGAHAPADDHDNHGQTTEPKKTSAWAIIGTVLASIAVGLLLILIFWPKPKPDPIIVWQWEIVNTQIVTLTKEYGGYYSFPNPDRFDGSGFDCINATKAYTVMNMAGDTASCNAGDNIAKYLPKSDPNNMQVRFKLRNPCDQIGEVTYISKKEFSHQVKK